jgi:hypothetical protein
VPAMFMALALVEVALFVLFFGAVPCAQVCTETKATRANTIMRILLM